MYSKTIPPEQFGYISQYEGSAIPVTDLEQDETKAGRLGRTLLRRKERTDVEPNLAENLRNEVSLHIKLVCGELAESLKQGDAHRLEEFYACVNAFMDEVSRGQFVFKKGSARNGALEGHVASAYDGIWSEFPPVEAVSPALRDFFDVALACAYESVRTEIAALVLRKIEDIGRVKDREASLAEEKKAAARAIGDKISAGRLAPTRQAYQEKDDFLTSAATHLRKSLEHATEQEKLRGVIAELVELDNTRKGLSEERMPLVDASRVFTQGIKDILDRGPVMFRDIKRPGIGDALRGMLAADVMFTREAKKIGIFQNPRAIQTMVAAAIVTVVAGGVVTATLYGNVIDNHRKRATEILNKSNLMLHIDLVERNGEKFARISPPDVPLKALPFQGLTKDSVAFDVTFNADIPYEVETDGAILVPMNAWKENIKVDKKNPEHYRLGLYPRIVLKRATVGGFDLVLDALRFTPVYGDSFMRAIDLQPDDIESVRRRQMSKTEAFRYAERRVEEALESGPVKVHVSLAEFHGTAFRLRTELPETVSNLDILSILAIRFAGGGTSSMRGPFVGGITEKSYLPKNDDANLFSPGTFLYWRSLGIRAHYVTDVGNFSPYGIMPVPKMEFVVDPEVEKFLHDHPETDASRDRGDVIREILDTEPIRVVVDVPENLPIGQIVGRVEVPEAFDNVPGIAFVGGTFAGSLTPDGESDALRLMHNDYQGGDTNLDIVSFPVEERARTIAEMRQRIHAARSQETLSAIVFYYPTPGDFRITTLRTDRVVVEVSDAAAKLLEEQD